ncbi:hypothetical protein EMIHUDRAFT_210142 [Emiliania huxleyi CCMP1516]|uniref:Uncharacterized protein n=2 Tax=Emiliania huxleyi TaxID=2903 RepID=A0A0D3J1P7_EMIH1|nr:hypothetical protein EMIHUDRAFT_210142 [Emiliania huxleyi CCMP1516]EOD17432.1 hypothetical protein EMIHUDRAFT_210142 [Emiliania huxleyi CCMP1516]|eukprot:XP_005769861.1 hypothetical protein EMIHUDRAFT_210142 [Emiliania huxleyi CCMP1516]
MGQGEWDADTEADAPRAQLLLAMIARRISLVSYTAAWEGLRGMASYGPAPPLDGAKGEEALRGIGRGADPSGVGPPPAGSPTGGLLPWQHARHVAGGAAAVPDAALEPAAAEELGRLRLQMKLREAHSEGVEKLRERVEALEASAAESEAAPGAAPLGNEEPAESSADARSKADAASAAAEERRVALDELTEEHEELLICLAEQDALAQALRSQLATERGAPLPATPATAALEASTPEALFDAFTQSNRVCRTDEKNKGNFDELWGIERGTWGATTVCLYTLGCTGFEYAVEGKASRCKLFKAPILSTLPVGGASCYKKASKTELGPHKKRL